MKKLANTLLILLALNALTVSYASLTAPIELKNVIYRLVAFVCSGIVSFLFIYPSTRKDISDRFISVIHRPLFIGVSAVMTTITLSALFAHNKYVAFFGEATRGEGFLTLFTIYVLFVLMSLLFERKQWEWFFGLSAFSVAVLFGREVWEVANGIDRPLSFIGNAIFLAAFYLFTFFMGWYFSFAQKKNNGKSWIGVPMMILSMAGIILSGTRGTLVGIAVALIICTIVMIIGGKQKKITTYPAQKIGLVIAGCLVVFLAVFASTHRADFWKSVPGLGRIAEGNTTTLDSRLIYLKIVRDGFKENTIQQKFVGWGWDNFWFFSNKNYKTEVYFYDQGAVDRAHNKLGDVLIMTGIVGLLVYVSLWYLLIKEIMKLMIKNYVVGIGALFIAISYFVHNLFAFDIPITLLMFYIFMAFISYYNHETK